MIDGNTAMRADDAGGLDSPGASARRKRKRRVIVGTGGQPLDRVIEDLVFVPRRR
jgi:hypothetical protein